MRRTYCVGVTLLVGSFVIGSCGNDASGPETVVTPDGCDANLKIIRVAAAAFEVGEGRPAVSVDEMVAEGYVNADMLQSQRAWVTLTNDGDRTTVAFQTFVPAAPVSTGSASRAYWVERATRLSTSAVSSSRTSGRRRCSPFYPTPQTPAARFSERG